MTKTSTGTGKAKSAKAATMVTDVKELQAASEAEGKVEGAAAPATAPEAKAPEPQTGADAADPDGTTDASAAPAEQSRERAEAPPSDQKGDAEEGKQPEVATQPAVADFGEQPQVSDGDEIGAILFVRGPAKGFRRAGVYFPAEGLALKPGDLGQGPEGVARLLAILKEPELTCKVREADGTEQVIPADEIAALEAKLESSGDEMADFVASLFDGDANPA